MLESPPFPRTRTVGKPSAGENQPSVKGVCDQLSWNNIAPKRWLVIPYNSQFGDMGGGGGGISIWLQGEMKPANTKLVVSACSGWGAVTQISRSVFVNSTKITLSETKIAPQKDHPKGKLEQG